MRRGAPAVCRGPDHEEGMCMLLTAVEKALAQDALAPRQSYRPFPLYSDRAAWANLSGEVKAYYAGFARAFDPSALLTPLPAVRYMDFQRDGNRKRYENLFFPRRSNLFALTLAECIEGRGRHIDHIINGVWAICEESNWLIPACNTYLRPGEPPRMLPDIEAPEYVDLFAAETGSLMSLVYYLLGEEIEKRAPQARRRMEIEVKKRLLDPYLQDDGYWWKGLVHEYPVNNWNPWINSNMLTAYLIMEMDEARRVEGVRRTAMSIQRFLHFYSEDGGCDEGPGYFGVAGASLLDYLEEMSLATGGAVNLYDQPIIANMAGYIEKVHIAGQYYVNFADAPPRVSVCTGLLQRAGRAIGNEGLVRFADHLLATGNADKPYIGGYNTLFRVLSSAFHYDACCEGAAKEAYAPPRDHMFAGIQVMTARQGARAEDGLFLACKGGHNAESHNHNDVGNFIIYLNGRPAVVDAGVEAYTKFTFNEQRYFIWTMRSEYHNVPTVNGCLQENGRSFAAADVHYSVEGGLTTLSMDIAGAYPKEACVRRYARSVCLDRDAGRVVMADEYCLTEAKLPLQLNLLCFDRPQLLAPGRAQLGELTLTFDGELFSAEVETVALTDEKIAKDWDKGELYRMRLTAREAQNQGGYTLVFAAP